MLNLFKLNKPLFLDNNHNKQLSVIQIKTKILKNFVLNVTITSF